MLTAVLHPHGPHPHPGQHRFSLGRQQEHPREFPCLPLPHLKIYVFTVAVMMPIPCLKPPTALNCPENIIYRILTMAHKALHVLAPAALPTTSPCLSLSLEQDTQPLQLPFCSPKLLSFPPFAPPYACTVPSAFCLAGLSWSFFSSKGLP